MLSTRTPLNSFVRNISPSSSWIMGFLRVLFYSCLSSFSLWNAPSCCNLIDRQSTTVLFFLNACTASAVALVLCKLIWTGFLIGLTPILPHWTFWNKACFSRIFDAFSAKEFFQQTVDRLFNDRFCFVFYNMREVVEWVCPTAARAHHTMGENRQLGSWNL